MANRNSFPIEVHIGGCYHGKIERFNLWRLALADQIGVHVVYSMKEASSDNLPPYHNWRGEFVRPFACSPTLSGQISSDPDALYDLVLASIPGTALTPPQARAIADRLEEMSELMWALDDGRYGLVDLGRMTEAMMVGLRCRANKGETIQINAASEEI